MPPEAAGPKGLCPRCPPPPRPRLPSGAKHLMPLRLVAVPSPRGTPRLPKGSVGLAPSEISLTNPLSSHYLSCHWLDVPAQCSDLPMPGPYFHLSSRVDRAGDAGYTLHVSLQFPPARHSQLCSMPQELTRMAGVAQAPCPLWLLFGA